MIEAPPRQKSGVDSGVMEPLAAHQTAVAPSYDALPAFLRPAPRTPSVALVGRAGTGKTTLALALEEYGYRRHTWAAPIYELAAAAYGPVAKDQTYMVEVHGEPTPVSGRWILQRIGTEALREQVDQSFWIKAGLRRLEPGRKYVNDDTRFLNEAAVLREAGFVIVRLTAMPSLRASRLGLTDRQLYEADDHPSEREQNGIYADLELSTNIQPAAEIAADLVAWLERRSAA